jgi:hypothetical protein
MFAARLPETLVSNIKKIGAVEQTNQKINDNESWELTLINVEKKVSEYSKD